VVIARNGRQAYEKTGAVRKKNRSAIVLVRTLRNARRDRAAPVAGYRPWSRAESADSGFPRENHSLSVVY
jgi:hypothetical protein